MTRRPSLKCLQHLLWAFLFATCAQAAQTDISTVPLETYSAPTSTDVKPNVLFVLDDSGSMDWDFMPDWACTGDLAAEFLMLQHRTVTPARPATNTGSATRRTTASTTTRRSITSRRSPSAAPARPNTTTYPSQTGTSAATGAGSGDHAQLEGSQGRRLRRAHEAPSPYTSNLVYDPTGATNTRPTYFYTIVPGEYCTTPSLRVCNAQTAPIGDLSVSGLHPVVHSSALTTCKAGFDCILQLRRGCRCRCSDDQHRSTAPKPRRASRAVTVDGANVISSCHHLDRPHEAEPDRLSHCGRDQCRGRTNGGYAAYAVRQHRHDRRTLRGSNRVDAAYAGHAARYRRLAPRMTFNVGTLRQTRHKPQRKASPAPAC